MTDSSRFGYTPEQWQAAVDAGVEILKSVARDRGTIHYQALCDRIHDTTGVEVVPGEHALQYVLGDISRSTLESDGIAITVLVTYKGSVEAGQGLYQLAEAEGLLRKNATKQEKEDFRIRQMNAAYETWPRVRRRPGERFQARSHSER